MLFKIQPHTGADKSFFILGPITLEVDYDDVCHKFQDRMARKIVRTLNKHWVDAQSDEQQKSDWSD